MMNETPRPTADDLAAVARCKARYDCVSAELGNVILGQRDAIEQVLIAVRAAATPCWRVRQRWGLSTILRRKICGRFAERLWNWATRRRSQEDLAVICKIRPGTAGTGIARASVAGKNSIRMAARVAIRARIGGRTILSAAVHPPPQNHSILPCAVRARRVPRVTLSSGNMTSYRVLPTLCVLLSALLASAAPPAGPHGSTAATGFIDKGAPSAKPAASQGGQAAAAFDRVMADALKNRNIPGGALAIVKGGKLVVARGYGLANVKTQEPVSLETLFSTASITKTITAAAVLRLVEQKKLSLDDPVYALLGKPRPLGARGSIRWRRRSPCGIFCCTRRAGTRNSTATPCSRRRRSPG